MSGYQCELGREQRGDDEFDSKLNTGCDLSILGLTIEVGGKEDRAETYTK
jgi:hypothetical protein